MTQSFELWVDSEIKVYRDTFKKDISFCIYVKNRYENFHCSVIVDNMKEDCVLVEKLRKLQRIVLVLCGLCALGFKKDGNVRKLERYITQRSITVWVLTSTYRMRIWRFGPGRGYISTGIAIHLPSLGQTFTINASNYSIINILIEMLRDDSAGKKNARCLYVCGNWPVPAARVWPI